MTDAAILSGIERVLREHVGVRIPVSPTTDLLRDLKLDSLKQLTLIVEIENYFAICFEHGDEAGVESVGDLMRLVARRLPGGAV